jgi:uncharacterized protein
LSAPDSLFDTSAWIALTFPAHPLHASAKGEFAAISAGHRVCFCRATQQSFLRLLTNDRVMAPFGLPPLSNHDALLTLDRYMAHRSVGFIGEPDNVFARWQAFADAPTPSPNRWMDAYLAAFAIEAGLQFVTGDRGFKSYAGLNPIVLDAPGSAATARTSTPPAAPGGGSSTP